VLPVHSERLCRALAGELDAGPGDESAGRFGGRLGDLWWLSQADPDSGATDTTLVRESMERREGGSVARLRISCGSDDRLQAAVWWRDLDSVSPMPSWRIGDRPWRRERWQTFSGTWGGSDWAVLNVIDAGSFLQALHCQGRAAEVLQMRFKQNRYMRQASFNLHGLFDTPVQAELARCGGGYPVHDPDMLIVDSGRSGDDLWWAVDRDQQPPETYVVKTTTMAGSTGEARLQLKCEQGALEVDVYWDVDEDLDRTVVYQIGGGPRQLEKWVSGWGRWGDVEYKWTGRADAAGLAWAAQAAGALVVEVHERGDPNRRYVARFELAGLFATPVQPNLASCGR